MFSTMKRYACVSLREQQRVLCPRCEIRHSLVEGAAEARRRDPKILERTWALKTQIENQRTPSPGRRH